jgi:hypothetical protein
MTLLTSTLAQANRIHIYAAVGNQARVENELNGGISVNVLDNRRRTPLHHTARNGHWDLLVVLLQRGALVNVVDQDNQTAAELARAAGHHDIADFLESGADLNQLDEYYVEEEDEEQEVQEQEPVVQAQAQPDSAENSYDAPYTPPTAPMLQGDEFNEYYATIGVVRTAEELAFAAMFVVAAFGHMMAEQAQQPLMVFNKNNHL